MDISEKDEFLAEKRNQDSTVNYDSVNNPPADWRVSGSNVSAPIDSYPLVCTLTDMQYVVFHGSVDTEGTMAYQEYYVRHIDGSPVKSEAEKQRVVQCLEAAIKRRVCEGLKLELCTTDRVGLLSKVTRIFRENSLTVTRAEVKTKGGKALNTFYVSDASGYTIDAKTIDSIRQTIGQTILKVKNNPEEQQKDRNNLPKNHQPVSIIEDWPKPKRNNNGC